MADLPLLLKSHQLLRCSNDDSVRCSQPPKNHYRRNFPDTAVNSINEVAQRLNSGQVEPKKVKNRPQSAEIKVCT
jgi:hypothetical protein